MPDCAFQHLRIAPYLPDSLDNLDVSTACPYGRIRVSWQRTADGCHFQFGIPAGTDATIILPVQPGSRITEGGRAIAAGRRGIRAVSNGPQTAEIAVGSGNYEFVVESKRNKP